MRSYVTVLIVASTKELHSRILLLSFDDDGRNITGTFSLANADRI